MGAICNQVDNQTFGTLEKVVQTNTKSQFEAAQLGEIPFLLNKIEEITKSHEQFHNFPEDRQLLKHKVKDLYYLGDWNEAGYQQGRGIIYSVDEYIFYGDVDTVPSGKGVLESITDQYIYEGEFNYGRIQGKGKVNSITNLFSFQGIFNSKSEPITGNFAINNPHDESKSYTIFLNNYPENKARLVYREGKEYEGEITFRNFVPHGQGHAKYSNNSYYQGEWENGQYHGRGKFVWPDGSSYEGDYQHGKKQGTGTFTYHNKKVYQGQWQNGKQSGEGTLYDPEGQIIKQGVWKDGKYEGPSEIKKPLDNSAVKLLEENFERQGEEVIERKHAEGVQEKYMEDVVEKHAEALVKHTEDILDKPLGEGPVKPSEEIYKMVE